MAAPAFGWIASLWRRRAVRWPLVGAVACLAAGLLALLAMNLWVTRWTGEYRYEDVREVPDRPVAIVFGAGVSGSDPTPALASRLDGAIELYRAGRVTHLLMSGDNGRPDYDEVTVMRDYAIDHGVPGSAITRDYAGFDTYDTCIRAREIFGVSSAVLVTQDFHIARAIYTCRQLGMDAVGLAIPDWSFREERLDYQYTRSQEIGYRVREWFARVKAVVDSELIRPRPTFGGPYEGLTET